MLVPHKRLLSRQILQQEAFRAKQLTQYVLNFPAVYEYRKQSYDENRISYIYSDLRIL